MPRLLSTPEELDGEAQNLLDDYIKQFQIGEPIPVSLHNDLSNPVAKTDTSEVRACGPAEHPGGIIVTPNSADPTPTAPNVTAAHTDGAPDNVPSEAASGDTPQAEKGTSSTSGGLAAGDRLARTQQAFRWKTMTPNNQ